MKRYEIIGEPTFDFMEVENGSVILYDDFVSSILAEIDKLKDYANSTGNYELAEFAIKQLENLIK
jgi:hypothetical protein